MMQKEVYVNLGCGRMFCKDWVNVDVVPADDCVIKHDLSQPLPFRDNSVNFIYLSQVVEHLVKADAERLLKECNRVIVAGGYMRLCTPDCEAVAREYLFRLERLRGDGGNVNRDCHEWACIELLDQLVRLNPGGEMMRFIQKTDPASETGQYVRKRIGSVAERIWAKRKDISGRDCSTGLPKSRLILGMSIRDRFLQLLLGEEYKALAAGRFVLSGEGHRWFYDFYSLSELLQKAGFAVTGRKLPGDSDLVGDDVRFGTQRLDLLSVESYAAHLIVECRKLA